jgi:hypothetical protein
MYDAYTSKVKPMHSERRKERGTVGACPPEHPEYMVRILDVVGGMERWRADVDPTFPKLV